METDLAREVASKISEIAGAVHEEANVAAATVDALAAGWDGPAADLFISEALSVLNNLRGLAYDGDSLAARLNQEIADWETQDQDSAAYFQGVGTVPMPPPAPGPIPEPPPPDPGPGDGPGDDPTPDPGSDDDDHEDPGQPTSSPSPEDKPAPSPGGSPAPAGSPAPGGSTSAPTTPSAEGPDVPGDEEAVVAGATTGAAAVGAAAGVSGKSTSGKKGEETETAVAPEALAADSEGSWSNRFAELDEVNAEIKTLEAKPYSSLSAEELTRLKELHQERNEIQLVMEKGIEADGPGPMHQNFPEGECTWYASSRRNFGWDISGDAKVWGEKALAAGYEVGEVPLKGAVMVWQPGAHHANITYGHVSFVERVVDLGDGSFKVFFTDNHFRDPGAPSSARIFPGEEGVSFIYGKLGG